MSKRWNVAVLGATGLVGGNMLSILEQRNFPVGELYPLASAKSVGKTIRFKGKEVPVLDVETFDFSKAQVGLFSAGASVSKVHAVRAGQAGCVVVDNTSQFRYQDDIPLVVTEVNPHAIAGYKKHNIIANPNCSTMQMLVALKPLHDAAGIERINVATYQSVSGGGQKAIDELQSADRDAAEGRRGHAEGHRQADRVQLRAADRRVPGQRLHQGRDEDVLGDPEDPRGQEHQGERHRGAGRRVRRPFRGGQHRDPTQAHRGRSQGIASKAPGVVLMDERKPGGYPTAVTEAAGTDPVFVGRIREDISHDRGLNLWIVSDNVRKGAALNSVQIAEILVKEYL